MTGAGIAVIGHMKKINRERVLLITLVAVAFFGFLLWSIDQANSEADSLFTAGTTISTKNTLTNAFIKVVSPSLNNGVKSPLTVSGQANVGVDKLKIRIKDNKNLILKESFAQTRDSKKMSDFSIKLIYKKPTATQGTVEVFLVSTKDNSEINKISVPVVFKD